MPAEIKASENPVVFTAAGQSKTITISWTSGDPALFAVLFISENGEPPTPVGTVFPATEGTVKHLIREGRTYTFSVRNLFGRQLATLTVRTTIKVPSPRPSTPAQRVHGVKVRVRADVAAMSWHTMLPAACWVDISAPGHRGFFAWTAPGSTEHHVRFAELDLHTEYRFRIVVAGGAARYEGVIRTGTRTVVVHFDTVKVRNDGDPGLKGAGEFRFSFGVGDVASTERLAMAFSGEREISSGETVAVNKKFTLDSAPRAIWLQAFGVEDDFVFRPGVGLSVVGMGPSFQPPGTWGWEDFDHAVACVTTHLDVVPDLGPIELGVAKYPRNRVISLTMRTGFFSIAFEVNVRVEVTSSKGSWRPGLRQLLILPLKDVDLYAEVETVAPRG